MPTKRKIVLSGNVIFTINLARKNVKVKALGGNSVITSFPNRYQLGNPAPTLSPAEIQERVRSVLNVH